MSRRCTGGIRLWIIVSSVLECSANSMDPSHLLAICVEQADGAIEDLNRDYVGARFEVDDIDLNWMTGLRIAPFAFQRVHGLPLDAREHGRRDVRRVPFGDLYVASGAEVRQLLDQPARVTHTNDVTR